MTTTTREEDLPEFEWPRRPTRRKTWEAKQRVALESRRARFRQ